MNAKPRRIHPLVAIAAISVTLFSLAGLAVVTGVMPRSQAQMAAEQQPVVTTPTAQPGTAATTASTAPVAKAAPPAPAKVVHRTAPKSAETARAAIPPLAAAEPPAAPKAAAPACRDCGTVESIRTVEEEGKGTGLGAIAGGVLGGVLGHQVGGGRGKDLATIVGAAGGAYAGHQVEKSQRKSQHYDVTVRLDDGSQRTVTYKEMPAWREGDRVKLMDGTLVSAP